MFTTFRRLIFHDYDSSSKIEKGLPTEESSPILMTNMYINVQVYNIYSYLSALPLYVKKTLVKLGSLSNNLKLTKKL